MRSENTIKNSAVAILVSTINLICSFIDRRFFIAILGVSYLGLNGVFKNILSILSIVELNIGSAIAFSLYKPLYENDKSKVSGLINFYKKIYSYIALIIGGLSLIISFFISDLFKDNTFDNRTLQIMFLLFSLTTISSYFFAHKRTLLYAMQKNYYVLIFDCLFNIISCFLHFLTLYILHSYIWYLITNICCQLLSNIFIYYFSKNLTNDFNEKRKLSCEERNYLFNDIKYMVILNVVGVGVLSSDNLIIAKVLGSKVVGLYSNYELITNMLRSYTTLFLNSVTASIGDLMAENNRKRLAEIFKIYDFCYFLIASYVCIAFFYISKKFIPLFFGNELLLNDRLTFIISINLFIFLLQQPIWQLQNLGKLFKESSLIGVVQLMINIFVSIALSRIIGLGGILLGTTLCYLFSWVLFTKLNFKKILIDGIKNYIVEHIKQTFLFLIEFSLVKIFIIFILPKQLDNIIFMILITFIIPNFINYFIYRNCTEMIEIKKIITSNFISK